MSPGFCGAVSHHFNGKGGVSCMCTHMAYVHTCVYINVYIYGYTKNGTIFAQKDLQCQHLKDTG